ncbi:MAG: polysaccharide deacetylase family protein [Lewinellaceae bacterium]|nr:polysaccharide deacetylase family protein [Lewinellaceae bacterium]
MPEVVWFDDLPALFPMPGPAPSGWHFDLFSMAFFLLSRYEEYLPGQRDANGRFPASASLAVQKGFLEIPALDCWIARLANELSSGFPELPVSISGFSFQPTFDVDQAWAYLHKPLWRQIGGILKFILSREWSRFLQRLAVWIKKESDPFDTFSFILQQHPTPPLFFFLLADPGPYDKNNPPDHPALQSLIRELATKAPLGIHPSYKSLEIPELVAKEKERLERITGSTIHKSRQHFLRLRLPETYRALMAAGIEEDYSMGYADAIGFRAGTAFPFRWYDLEMECATELLVHPFQAMDVTLRQYLGLSPEEAMTALSGLLEKVRQTGGPFCTVWHNSSFDEKGGWRGWTAVYRHLLKECQNQTQE